jgi:hypothetical protein
MTTDQQVEILATAAGTVEIGSPPQGPGANYFPVLGGLMAVEVTGSGANLFASIADTSAAAWWLSLVYGDDVASAVMELGGLIADRVDSETVGSANDSRVAAFFPGPLFQPVVRFGAGSWIHRWWPTPDVAPLPIDETLIALEVGTLAWAIEYVFGGLEVAGRYLEPRVNELLTMVKDGRSTDSNLIGPALRATLESVPLAPEVGDALRALESVIDRVDAQRADFEDEAISIAITAWQLTRDSDDAPEFLLRVPATSLVARGAASASSTEHFLVDVELCPPRALSWSEDAIETSLTHADGSVRVRTRVKAGSQPTTLSMYCRVYVEDEPSPRVVFKLELNADGTFEGVAQFEAPSLPESFLSDVFAAELLAAPDPRRAMAMRSEVAPIFEDLASRSRAKVEDSAIQQLGPEAPWRALMTK